MRSGFSVVEIVIALCITLLLTMIGIELMTQYQAWAKEKVAVRDIESIRRTIERHQVETKAAWTSRDLPEGGRGRDPWGQSYRIDPVRRMVWSAGQNSVDEQGGGDDIAVTFDTTGHGPLGAPARLKVVESDATSVTLGWVPVRYPPGLQGYNVYRRAADALYTTSPINIVPLAPAEDPRYRDGDLAPGVLYYYSVEVVGADGARERSRGQVAFQLGVGAEGSP